MLTFRKFESQSRKATASVSADSTVQYDETSAGRAEWATFSVSSSIRCESGKLKILSIVVFSFWFLFFKPQTAFFRLSPLPPLLSGLAVLLPSIFPYSLFSPL